MNKIVTIVIPAYKVEKYLGKCVESVIHQEYTDLDIILVPQPGGDECEAICREYEGKDKRIRVFPQEYCDLSNARNVGIENAIGEYIAFIDSDDLVSRKFISRLVQIMQEDDADIVQCTSYAFVDEKQISHRINGDFIHVHTGKEMCYKLAESVYGSDAGVIQTKLYKKNLFDNIRFPNGRLNEDGATNYQLYWNANRVAVTGEKLYFYRSKRKDSIIHTISDRLCKDTLISSRERCSYFMEKDIYLYTQAVYLLNNDLTRARNIVKKKEDRKVLKEEQKLCNSILKNSTNISRKRFILARFSYLFPKGWMFTWKMRKRYREFVEWKIKGARK